jgi:hypothetical protein
MRWLTASLSKLSRNLAHAAILVESGDGFVAVYKPRFCADHPLLGAVAETRARGDFRTYQGRSSGRQGARKSRGTRRSNKYAASHTSRLRHRPAERTSIDWNGDYRCCRARHTRGPPSLHAGCDVALFRFPFRRIANDEVHDSQAGTVESGMPRAMGHGTYHRAYRHYRYCTHGRCR